MLSSADLLLLSVVFSSAVGRILASAAKVTSKFFKDSILKKEFDICVRHLKRK